MGLVVRLLQVQIKSLNVSRWKILTNESRFYWNLYFLALTKFELNLRELVVYWASYDHMKFPKSFIVDSSPALPNLIEIR
jgi:hypothetical protein